MTQQLQRGGNISLTSVGLASEVTVSLTWDTKPGVDADLSAFLVGDNGKVASDDDFIFFNQPADLASSVKHLGKSARGAATVDALTINTALIPAHVDRVVVGASLDGGTFGDLTGLGVELSAAPGATVAVRAELGATNETGFVFGEVYKRNGDWKFRAVGQGFITGLAGLATDHGVDIEEEPAPVAAAPAPTPTPAAPATPPAPVISMAKQRIVNIEKKLQASNDTTMVSLVKTAGLSLAKKGLSEHTARVALVLDISGSMASRYRKGLVQKVAERVLALGLRFDDDGEIDVFLFGANVHQPEPLTINGYQTYVRSITNRYRLEMDTKYGAAIRAVREHYFGSAKERVEVQPDAVPVHVLFLTDGAPSDKGVATKQIKSASYEPIFWNFIGIGSDRFDYLRRLDDLSGRFTDNADFFAVSDDEILGRNPISDEALYDRLMNEYPDWLKRARTLGILTQ